VLPIQFAHVLSSGGPRAMHRQLMSLTLKVLPVMALYCLLMAMFAGPLLGLFGRAFVGRRGILEVYSLVAFITYAQMLVAAALTAKRGTRFIFMGSVWGASIALLLGTALIKLLGVYGALVGMLLTAATVCTLYWKAYRSTIAAQTDADGEACADLMAPAMGAEDQPAVIGEAGAS
jgi:O-antigen/teichoic acid export membrane protein